jgi:hypothetical protein
MEGRTERRICWGVSALGAIVAAAAAYALFAVPVASPVAAAVRSLSVVAGLTVAVGGWLPATGRLPVRPVAPMAAGPGALAGAALVMSGDGLPTWMHVAVGASVAAGILGYALVVAGTVNDND